MNVRCSRLCVVFLAVLAVLCAAMLGGVAAAVSDSPWSQQVPPRGARLVNPPLPPIQPAAGGAALPLAAAGATPDWLQHINNYRVASGLTPVVEQPAWTLGIQHHLVYMAKTPSEYFTGQYVSLHTENPASPYYTEDGAREAGCCDLGWGTTDVEAIDVWLRAPLHAIGMLRPQLGQVAFARSSTSTSAGLDVIQGLDYGLPAATAPILFPGPGMVTDLPMYGGESPDVLETCGWQGLTVGLPLIVLLPQAPDPGLAATLLRPDGSSDTTADGDLKVVDAYNYVSSDPVYGPTGLGILRGDRAVLLIPRHPLTNGTYLARIQQPGQADIAWSFFVAAPPPVTTIEDLPTGWVNHVVELQLRTANSWYLGVDHSEFKLDEGTWTAGDYVEIQAPFDHVMDGVHTVQYRSMDRAGNLEEAKSVAVKIDTTGPVTYARTNSGRQGHAVALRYMVADSLSPKVVSLRIVVRSSRGKAVGTVRPSTKDTAAWWSVKWTPKARGTFRYYVCAKDLAGNAQRRVGSAKVVVR